MGGALYEPLRQLDMKVLRASPASFCELACVLQAFILSCCDIDDVPLPLVVLPLRQSDMKVLRASPASFCAPAWVLQDFMRSCCAFWVECVDCCAKAAGAAAAPPALNAAGGPRRVVEVSEAAILLVRAILACGGFAL